MSLRLTHIRLLVSNFRECFRFYRDVLGFEASYGKEEEVYADFVVGEITLALFQRQVMAEAVGTRTLPVSAPCQDRAALIFSAANVDEAYDRLRKKGVRFVTQPTDRPEWGIRTAHFRDPDGNLLEMYSSLNS